MKNVKLIVNINVKRRVGQPVLGDAVNDDIWIYIRKRVYYSVWKHIRFSNCIRIAVNSK